MWSMNTAELSLQCNCQKTDEGLTRNTLIHTESMSYTLTFTVSQIIVLVVVVFTSCLNPGDGDLI